MIDQEQELCNQIASFASDPEAFVRFAYPWGEPGELEDVAGPRTWQVNILRTIRDHLASPERYNPLKIAVSSGHGIGKSALISMVCGWSMSCFVDARVNVTANTGKQLETKTWPELSIWFRRMINAHWWNVKAESVSAKDEAHVKTWRIDAVPWSESNPAAFAGLHNKRKIIVLIMDESSEIADVVWETTEGATTDEDTIIIWLAFGNPTRNSGRFARCFGDLRKRWKTFQIDARTVEGTNKAEFQSWVEDYGEDSDFVRVRVRGVFPRAGSTQFIDGDTVRNAQLRTIPEQDWQNYAKVISVDVARFGDDRTVIGMRQGNRFVILDTLRGKDTQEVGQHVCGRIKEHQARLAVIDDSGVGGGVTDYVKAHMRKYFEQPEHRIAGFLGAESPKDPNMYFNRRVEVWGLMREWLKEGDIPTDPELWNDLTGPQYGFSNKGAIQLEKKEDMKKRGIASPDKGDTLSMSFAFQAPAKTHRERVQEELEAAKDPIQKHLIQWRETARLNKEEQREWWQ